MLRKVLTMTREVLALFLSPKRFFWPLDRIVYLWFLIWSIAFGFLLCRWLFPGGELSAIQATVLITMPVLLFGALIIAELFRKPKKQPVVSDAPPEDKIIWGSHTFEALNEFTRRLRKELSTAAIKVAQKREGLEVLPEDLDQAWLNLMEKWQGKKLTEILEERSEK